MDNETHYRKLENMMHSAPIVKLAGAKARIGKGKAEITLQVDPKLFHAAGALHGSMYFLALDNAAFFAANSLVEKVFVLTANFNIYLIRPIKKGTLTATGRVVSQTRTQFICQAVACDDEGREVAWGIGTFVRSRQPLNAEIGYK